MALISLSRKQASQKVWNILININSASTECEENADDFCFERLSDIRIDLEDLYLALTGEKPEME